MLASTGCVERLLRIESEPAGAEIYVNGRHAGVAPVDWRFTYYGTLRVDAWTPGRPGLTQEVELVPPWWQRYVFDLFTEILSPFKHVDRHAVTLVLPPPATAERADVQQRADDLRAETR